MGMARMEKAETEGARGGSLPKSVQNLIARALKQARRQKNIDLGGIVSRTYDELNQNIQNILQALGIAGSANVTKERLVGSFVPVAEKGYRELAKAMEEETKAWPLMVWQQVKAVLDETKVAATESDLNAIVDEYSWAIGKDPFTMAYVEPERYKDIFYRLIDRYGVRGAASEVFEYKLQLDAAAAKAGLMNWSRFARENAGIEIDKYVLSAASVPARTNCISNPPKKEDDWYEVIFTSTANFFRENGRCPSESELWTRLRTSPPETYGVTSTTDRGEEAVGMGAARMGKGAFRQRWKRYTTTPTPASRKKSKSIKIGQ